MSNANNFSYKLLQNSNQYEIDLARIHVFVVLKSKHQECEIKRSFNMLVTILNLIG